MKKKKENKEKFILFFAATAVWIVGDSKVYWKARGASRRARRSRLWGGDYLKKRREEVPFPWVRHRHIFQVGTNGIEAKSTRDFSRELKARYIKFVSGHHVGASSHGKISYIGCAVRTLQVKSRASSTASGGH